ncbi:type II toxin-antitoxin system RelE/ParE family toxin [Neorhizobium alkalisoli]|uniref:type II toxin-antitoxin system RelE/ParE family toxin n=1 Tax=Neorhizobium alkalisoli TaxID=528178 RepID=UPI000CF91ECD|nr:type II toxin-antitoxin system RelE/ParE family toxin [Neorhizobium alkalisoli]
MAGSSRHYRLSPLAEADLEKIWSYTVEAWSWEQAERYHGEMLDIFAGLAAGQLSGRRTDVREGYLKYPIGSHFVFYRLGAGGIEVIRILHQRMDVSRHL